MYVHIYIMSIHYFTYRKPTNSATIIGAARSSHVVPIGRRIYADEAQREKRIDDLSTSAAVASAKKYLKNDVLPQQQEDLPEDSQAACTEPPGSHTVPPSSCPLPITLKQIRMVTLQSRRYTMTLQQPSKREVFNCTGSGCGP